jgi:hypothetical protein
LIARAGCSAGSSYKPGSDHVKFPEGRGHWIPEERPEWTVQQILDFFGEED